MVSMDDVDRTLLVALQANGRISNADLARAVDLAPSSTLERVRRLEERGLIRGYRAVLDPPALGYQVQAMVLINLDRHQAGPIDEFEARVRAVPEVVTCLHVTGRYDYMLHLVVRDIDHLRSLLTHGLGAIRGVEKQETFLVLSTVKEDLGLSLDGSSGDAGDSPKRASGASSTRS
jgi:Lrp/AsnC family transcriptional regulator, leucine-responsive regulatory protein